MEMGFCIKLKSLEFVLSFWFSVSSKFKMGLMTKIDQLARNWLTASSQDQTGLRRDPAIEEPRALTMMYCLIVFSLLMPFTSIAVLLPVFTFSGAIAITLCVVGFLMLAAGILAQTRSVKLSAIPALLSFIMLSSFGLGGAWAELATMSDAKFVVIFAIWLAAMPILLNGMSFSVMLMMSGRKRSAQDIDVAQNTPNKEALPPARALLMHMPGLVTRHDNKGDVIAVHGQEPAMLARRAENLHGRGFFNQIHVSDRINFIAAIDQLRQGKSSAKVNLRFETSSDLSAESQFTHIKAHLIAIHDQNGILSEFYVQSLDVTDHALIRDELADFKDAERDAEINKTRFLAGVSHELRTPLNSIMGFADVLIHDVIAPLPDERHKEYVSLIRESGEHLLNVVNTMLDMSKIQNGQYTLYEESFDFAPLLDRTKSMLDIQAEKKQIKLTCRAPKDLPEVEADSRAVQQILINLVGNSIKFTKDGGTVTVDASVGEEGQFVLKVSDTGIGIPEDKLSQIGQPFMQVNSSLARQYEGTGLGLSLVKGLVGLHKGTFDIKSTEGVGTDITIIIPQAGAQSTDDERTGHEQNDEGHMNMQEATFKGDRSNVA